MLLVFASLTGSAFGGFIASIPNTANTVRTGTLLLKDTPASSGCDTSTLPAFTALPVALCPGASLLPAATPGTSSWTVTANGTLPTAAQLSSASARLTAGACGPVQLANSVAAADPMLVRGGVGYQVPGPLTGTTGLSLDGVAANHTFTSDVVTGRNSQVMLGGAYTVAIWFKVAAGKGGPLAGLGDSPNDLAEGINDTPVMWIDLAGGVHAGMRGALGGSGIADSVATGYNNNAWHLAVMTVTQALGATVTISVDGGAAVSKGAGVSLSTGFPSAYWHAGWSPVSLAPWSSGTTNYLTGSVANMATFATALSAATVSGLATSGSQATWLSRITAASATNAWAMSDDGSSVYTGALPFAGLNAACSYVDLTIGGSGYCIYPNTIAASCPAAPTTANKLSGLAAAGSLPVPPLPAGASGVLATTTIRDTTYANTPTGSGTFLPGLHLLIPLSLTESLGAFGSTLSFYMGQTII